MPQNIALILFELFIMVFSICLHGCAQAWMANRQGDPSARMVGRMTMNPSAHFDVWGMVLWPLLCALQGGFIFGWGKAVPMTYRNFRKKNGEIIAILAGPAVQLLLAVIALLLLIAIKHSSPENAQLVEIAEAMSFRVPFDFGQLPAVFPLILLLYTCVLVNLLLCVFNLIPVPFFDGGRVLAYFLPYNAARTFEQYTLYFRIAFFLFGYTVIWTITSPILRIVHSLI